MEKDKKKSFKSFEDLECWKTCTDVRRFITELVKKYPKEEKFALVDDKGKSYLLLVIRYWGERIMNSSIN